MSGLSRSSGREVGWGGGGLQKNILKSTSCGWFATLGYMLSVGSCDFVVPPPGAEMREDIHWFPGESRGGHLLLGGAAAVVLRHGRIVTSITMAASAALRPLDQVWPLKVSRRAHTPTNRAHRLSL